MANKVDLVDIIRFFFIMVIFWFFVGTYLCAGIDWLVMNGKDEVYVFMRLIILVCFFASNILYWNYTSDRR